ncbi:MAG: Transketolase (EC [uncultured Caballeronia sp.]|nr:MAG: Transketolase (EC [uncultured Caballeronia sp.]
MKTATIFYPLHPFLHGFKRKVVVSVDVVIVRHKPRRAWLARGSLLVGDAPVVMALHLLEDPGCRCGASRASARPTQRNRRSCHTPSKSSSDLDTLAINTIRTLFMDAVQKANSGHPGTPMALVPVGFTCGKTTCVMTRLSRCGRRPLCAVGWPRRPCCCIRCCT